MKAQFISENLNFERGKDPKSTMGIGMQEKLEKAMEDDAWHYSNDDSALSWAAMKANLKFTEYLLKKGADPNAYNQRTLQRAVLGGSPEIMKMLLKAGADPNEIPRIDLGRRVITEQTDIQMLQSLLDHGLDLTLHDETELALLAAHKPVDFMKLLIDRGMDISNINLFHVNTAKKGGKYLLDQMSKLASEQNS